jgi:hypothetical protein
MRLARDGPNVLTPAKSTPVWRLVCAFFFSWVLFFWWRVEDRGRRKEAGGRRTESRGGGGRVMDGGGWRVGGDGQMFWGSLIPEIVSRHPNSLF